ncbi:MAG: TolC family protein [bacterium]|jgi:outer membrane protein TolC/ABC-type uncharacterized transport system substrate-binding protein
MKNKILSTLASIMILSPLLFGANSPRKVTFGYFESGAYFMHKVTSNELKEKLRIYSGDRYQFEFAPSGYFSANWDRELSRAMARELKRNKEIDMVLAAGPWVVEDLLAAEFNKPIIAICQFDPASAGLIDAAGKPVATNLTLTYYPNRIRNDLAAIKRILPDRKVGFIYYPDGAEYERLKAKIEQVAAGLGIEMIFAREMTAQGKFSYFVSLQKMPRSSTVLYLPPLWSLDLEQMRAFFFEAQSARIATFSSEGYLILEKDATASNSIWPYRAEASFCARKIIAIADGAAPDSLPIILEQTENLCLNLEAASKIGAEMGRRVVLDAKIIPARAADSALNLTLSAVLERALNENAGYLARGQIYERIVADASRAIAEFLPEINLELSAAQSNYAVLSSRFDDYFRRKYEWGAFARQKIFSYPAIKELEIAGKKKQLGAIELEGAKLALKSAVVKGYLGVLEAEDRLAAQVEITDRLLDLRETLTALAKAGYASLDELPLVEQRLTEAKIAQIEYQQELKIARTVLSVLINRPGVTNIALDRAEFQPEMMSLMVRKYEEYLADNKKEKKLEQFFIETGIARAPELAALELTIGLQRNLLSQKGKWYLPELSLQGGYSYGVEFYPKVSKRRDYWIVGGVLEFPLSLGRNFFGGSGGEKARLEESIYRKDALRFDKMTEIKSSLENLITRITTLPLNYFHRNLSSAALEASREKLDAGNLTLAEFIYLEEKNAASAHRTIDDRFGFFRAYIDLFHEIGTGYMLHGSPAEMEFYQGLERYIRE